MRQVFRVDKLECGSANEFRAHIPGELFVCGADVTIHPLAADNRYRIHTQLGQRLEAYLSEFWGETVKVRELARIPGGASRAPVATTSVS